MASMMGNDDELLGPGILGRRRGGLVGGMLSELSMCIFTASDQYPSFLCFRVFEMFYYY